MTASTTENVAVEVAYTDLLPTRKRVDPSANEGQVLFVTMNEAGSYRSGIVNEGGPKLKVGSTFQGRNPVTGHKYGEITIVGRVNADGRKTGDVPEGTLPLRLIG